MKKVKITIFTPTYNRAYILNQAYNSLINQTDKNFVWLIVDDGSIDNTKDVVEKWRKENTIKIKYVRQDNSGKHIAHNTAIKDCDTEFFLILDSDDFLSRNAIEILNKEVEKIKDDKSISGIIGNRWRPESNEVIGTEMPKNIDTTTGLELYQKLGFKGDTLRLYKTKILKEYLFPQIHNEKFIYENVVFNPIDSKYRMLINRDKLYYCKYLNDGYTYNSKKIREENPKGYAYSLNSNIKYAIKLTNKIKWTILYIDWCREHKIENRIRNFCFPILYVVLYPSALLYSMNKKEISRKHD